MADQKAIITQAAQKYGIDPKILYGLYGTETSFGKNVSRSSAGAVGPFQFLPSTAKSLGVNPYDFKSAAFGAAKYLSQYKGRGVGGMLSAYNAGPVGGYQSGYVSTTLKNAQSYGSAPSAPVPQGTTQQRIPGIPAREELNAPAFRKAGTDAAIGKLIASTEGAKAKNNPLFATGILSTKEPNPAEYQQTIPGRPGRPETSISRMPDSTGGGGKLGGFLPGGAELQMNRLDRGQDIKTNPGGPIVAPGDGVVIAVKSDPGGFGPDYPVVKFTSGPMAGQSWYLGHTHSALKPGEHFRAGQTLSHTGTHGVGNATVPGWAEIGMSSSLGQPDTGQGKNTVPYLRKR
jgi:hypothetical protein